MTPAESDPEAERILREFSSYLRSLKRFSLDIDATMVSTHGGVTADMSSAYGMAVERPNKLSLVLRSGSMGTTIVCDGEMVYRYWAVMQQYAETRAPASLDGLAHGSGGGPEFGIPACVDVLIADDPYRALMASVTRAAYLGIENTGGVACHHVKVFRRQEDWELWVGVDENPLLRRYVPDLSTSLAQATLLNPTMKGMAIQVGVTLQNWQVDMDLPEEQFRFTPPEGVVKIDESALIERQGVCERCGQPANVHITNAIADDPAAITSRHLCSTCAAAEGLLRDDMPDGRD
jgi:hypothetical protein